MPTMELLSAQILAKAAAQSDRITILLVMANNDEPVYPLKLERDHGVCRGAAGYHLEILRIAGLIERHREDGSRRVMYRKRDCITLETNDDDTMTLTIKRRGASVSITVPKCDLNTKSE